MKVRTANPADLDAILDMRMALFEESGDRMSPTERKEVLHANETYFNCRSNDYRTWVAVEDEQVVGVGTLAFFFRPPYPGNLAGKEAYLLNMYTRPKHRGRGIAKAVLNEALTYAKEGGFGKVWLHATAAGRPIYEANGFSPVASYMERNPGDA